MNIIIVGCGKVGYALAEQLNEEGHDITIMDNKATWAIAFNKDLIAENNLKSPYDSVNDKTWTYDQMYYLMQETTTDVDGNEIMEILNIKPSKIIGEILENIKIAQLSGEITTKEKAIEFVKNYKK